MRTNLHAYTWRIAALEKCHPRTPVMLREEKLDAWFSGNKLDYFLQREPFRLKGVQVE